MQQRLNVDPGDDPEPPVSFRANCAPFTTHALMLDPSDERRADLPTTLIQVSAVQITRPSCRPVFDKDRHVTHWGEAEIPDAQDASNISCKLLGRAVVCQDSDRGKLRN